MPRLLSRKTSGAHDGDDGAVNIEFRDIRFTVKDRLSGAPKDILQGVSGKVSSLAGSHQSWVMQLGWQPGMHYNTAPAVLTAAAGACLVPKRDEAPAAGRGQQANGDHGIQRRRQDDPGTLSCRFLSMARACHPSGQVVTFLTAASSCTRSPDAARRAGT